MHRVRSLGLSLSLLIVGTRCLPRTQPGALGPTPPAERALLNPGRPRSPSALLRVTGDFWGNHHTYTGPGVCEHTRQAYISGIPAEVWHASFTAAETSDFRKMTLRVWLPKGLEESQFALTIQIGGVTYSISTVRGERMFGTGSASLHVQDATTVLEIDGEEAGRAAIRLTAECPTVIEF